MEDLPFDETESSPRKITDDKMESVPTPTDTRLGARRWTNGCGLESSPTTAWGLTPPEHSLTSLDSIGKVQETDGALSPIPFANTANMYMNGDTKESGVSDFNVPGTGPDVRDEHNGNSESFRDAAADSDDERRDLNDSVASRNSLREEEIERMTEEVGATSLEFIRRLRGAAFRRKLDLTRSRDSLAAKEREKRKELAASRAATVSQRRNSEPAILSSAEPPARTSNWFHARRLPKTNGIDGNGGLSGVPKVQKKPATVPASPLLGARRPKPEAHNLAMPTRDQKHESSSPSRQSVKQNLFRALPLPRTTGEGGNAGMAGVPKVPKRSSTVPQSPLLGHRRALKPSNRRLSSSVGAVGIPKISKRPTTVPHSPLLGLRRGLAAGKTQVNTEEDPKAASSQQRPISNGSQKSGASSATLVGLRLIDSDERSRHHPDLSKRSPLSSQDTNQQTIVPFQPHSTYRAAARATFEARKSICVEQRQRRQSHDRRKKVKALKEQLRELRTSL